MHATGRNEVDPFDYLAAKFVNGIALESWPLCVTESRVVATPLSIGSIFPQESFLNRTPA